MPQVWRWKELEAWFILQERRRTKAEGPKPVVNPSDPSMGFDPPADDDAELEFELLDFPEAP